MFIDLVNSVGMSFFDLYDFCLTFGFLVVFGWFGFAVMFGCRWCNLLIFPGCGVAGFMV